VVARIEGKTKERQPVVKADGTIDVACGDVGVPRAPRIFRFRVGSGERIQADRVLRENGGNVPRP
jgi:hypothetical protein